jgi:hypothetical protein
VPNVFARGFKSLEALVGICVVAFDVDPDFRGSAVVSDVDSRHADQPDARIGQFTFDERFDLLAQGLANPPAMVLQPPLLQDAPHSKTHENIRKTGAGVVIRHRYCRWFRDGRRKYGGNKMLGVFQISAVTPGFKVSKFQGFKDIAGRPFTLKL